MMFGQSVMCTSWSRWLAVVAVFLASGYGQAPEQKESLEKYSVKACKYNLLPQTLGSRAWKNFLGEVHVYDVFGMPAAIKRHVMRLDIDKESFITVQAELHRDTPTALSVDVYRRGAAGKAGGRVLSGSNHQGAGGADTKAFVHGVLNEKLNGEVDIVFELIAVEVEASQVDARANQDRCWPVRLDLSVIPTSRAALHWPTRCPSESALPPALGEQVVTLPEEGLKLDAPQDSGKHFSFRFGGERPQVGFSRSLWTGTIEVPVRLHRFARFFFRVSFRFASSPLQLLLELYDLKDEPDGNAMEPQCTLGCLGGVPVYNGQVFDHAMPTGFRYKVWLLAANLEEWTASSPEIRGRQCTEFDLDYSVRYEQRMTPFEVGPSAWLCESTRLPQRIVQTAQPATNAKAKDNLQIVSGRTIWIRDRFGFPPEEISDMEHKIEIVIEEPSIFRATTHHSDGVDVFLALTEKGQQRRACQVVRHPGPVPRQTIFCQLQPGTYTLTVFADFPLGGLHPCSDFFAQLAIRPLALNDDRNTQQCLSTASDLTKLKVKRSLESVAKPNWKTMRVPIKFSSAPSATSIWSQSIEILDGEEDKNLFLRLVVHSDYVSSDLRFQVKYEGKYIADTQVTSHGYADMIGPLDSGTYTVGMYYVVGVGPSDAKLCSTSMVDLRIVSKAQYANRTSQWLCSSTRVPPPEVLTPQPDEQILLDSDYVVPDSGVHTMRLVLQETRVIRMQATAADAEFLIQLRTWPGLDVVASSKTSLLAVVGKGSFALRIKAIVHTTGNSGVCSTMRVNMLIQPYNAMSQCPWGSNGIAESAADTDQISAADHIGNVLLDLVPQTVTKDTKPNPPVTLWMNEGMEKTFEMNVDQTSAVRLDVVVQPPFLPLVVQIRRQRSSGKIEPPIAVAEWMENRLLLLQSDLPRGKYLVEFAMPHKFKVHGDADLGEGSISSLCAHVTIFAEVGVSSKEAINSMRAELLDLPDLLAVQPFLPNLNAVGWFSSALTPSLGTQVYNFPENSGRASLIIEDKAVVRIICEPADLSNSEATVSLIKPDSNNEVVAYGDNLGTLVAEVDPGKLQLVLTPEAKAPFLVTVGVATFPRLKEDILLQDSAAPCASTAPKFEEGVVFSPRGWVIGPTNVRLTSDWLQQKKIATVPVEITSASILYIETGSALPLDLVRISLQVPEGMWIGEQRGTRNSLQIELPPGKYVAHIGNPKPIGLAIKRCLDFSVFIMATPINPDAVAVAEAALASKDGSSRKELDLTEEASIETAQCFSMGTVPLPLDLSEPGGGSKILGGPLGKDGRLLVRQRVLVTDMHDGRKKMYLKTRRKKLLLKVGIIISGYARLSHSSQLTFSVQKIGAPAPLEPVETWSQESGWERIYILDETASGFWLAFHHAHREQAESACLHFGLELEIHPFDDTRRMFECPSDAESPEDLFPDSLNVDQNEQSRKSFKYSKQNAWLRQPQRGFLKKVAFSLTVTSFVTASIAHNFFLSHGEMDIITYTTDGEKRRSVTLAAAEPEFIHTADHPLNVRQVVGTILEPGDYFLRVADDHYPGQLAGADSACFPFSFEFHVVPEKAPPAIISVLPHPSVPIPKGVDLLMTVRFSEPPAGSLPDVISQFSLGGFQASTGGSMNTMSSQYISQQRTAKVTAETAEGHRVWIIGWSSQVLAAIGGTAKLVIGTIRSNSTQRIFKFNAPTYTIAEAPKGAPWSAGAKTSSDGAMPSPDSSSSGGVGESMPEKSGAGVDATVKTEEPSRPSAGSSSSAGGLGDVAPESSIGGVKAEKPSIGSALAETPKSETPASPSPSTLEDSSVGAAKPEGSGVGAKAGGTGEVRAEGKPRLSAADKMRATMEKHKKKDEEDGSSETSPAPSPSSTPRAVSEFGMPKAEVGVPKAEVGMPRAEVGMPKAETGFVQAESNADAPKKEDVHVESTFDRRDDFADHAPRVRVWTPDDARPPPAPSKMEEDDDGSSNCPDGTKMNVLTGICDSAPLDAESGLLGSLSGFAPSMPSGYGSIMAASAGILVGLAAMMNGLPHLKNKLTSTAGRKSSGPGARFTDIGHRAAEEERGLMSSSWEDEDML
jgi:hypothetical protein